MDFPGVIIKRGIKNASQAVRAIQARLNELGFSLDVDGDFGPKTESALKRFQATHIDKQGAPLVVDGQVGPITWAALFDIDAPPQAVKAGLAETVLAIARAEFKRGVIETSPNRSVRIDEYNRRAGLSESLIKSGKAYWCLSFIYFCFDEAAKQLGIENPMLQTASCSVLYRWAKKNRLLVSIPEPGCIALIKGGNSGHQHCGLVEVYHNGYFDDYEGNSNNTGSSNGIAVVRQAGARARKANTCDFVKLH